jgi:hypothetical protein
VSKNSVLMINVQKFDKKRGSKTKSRRLVIFAFNFILNAIGSKKQKKEWP